MSIRVDAARSISAPPAVVYGCIADYRQHHRPGGFLPPAFTDLQVERGGVGAGTVIRMSMRLAGSTRELHAEITEPEPGRVLVETSDVVVTAFRVEPDGPYSRVQIVSDFMLGAVMGWVMRPLLPRMLAPIYADELARLDAYAQQQATAQA